MPMLRKAIAVADFMRAWFKHIYEVCMQMDRNTTLGSSMRPRRKSPTLQRNA